MELFLDERRGREPGTPLIRINLRCAGDDMLTVDSLKGVAMFTLKTFVATAATALALNGCAAGTAPSEPHQHMRDAKQGTTLPSPAAGASAPKLLHDHREMK